MVVWLFLTVPWVCLWFVIAEFPDHSHLLILISHNIQFCKHRITLMPIGIVLSYFVELLLITECTCTAIKYGWMSYFLY